MTVLCLTHGKYAIIDDDDFDFVNQWRWRAGKSAPGFWYAIRLGKGHGRKGMIYLHRELSKAKRGEMIDHKNRDSLDNRKENLRLCTRSQNNANRNKKWSVSGFKGVTKRKKYQKWRVAVADKYVGTFDTAIEAAKAYDAKAIEVFGEFACTNKSLGLLEST